MKKTNSDLELRANMIQFRINAEHCRIEAERSETKAGRAEYKDLAKRWDEIAIQAENLDRLWQDRHMTISELPQRPASAAKPVPRRPLQPLVWRARV